MDQFEDAIFFYVIGVEADSREKRSSIFRNFVAGTDNFPGFSFLSILCIVQHCANLHY